MTSIPATFHALVGELEYPMFIVTARAGGEPLGCLVGFATQMSIDPGASPSACRTQPHVPPRPRRRAAGRALRSG